MVEEVVSQEAPAQVERNYNVVCVWILISDCICIMFGGGVGVVLTIL